MIGRSNDMMDSDSDAALSMFLYGKRTRPPTPPEIAAQMITKVVSMDGWHAYRASQSFYLST